MEHRYCNDSLGIFEGFYESGLYNSDTEYNFNYNREDGEPEYELQDFASFKNAVGQAAKDLLCPMLERDGFIKNVTFAGISSPMYYNFTTDRLLIDMDVDFDALKAWVLATDERRDGFNDYLKHNYTSYDGFCSFVENNVEGFFENSYGDYKDVLIDYYLLVAILDTEHVTDEDWTESSYRYDLVEAADELLWEFMVPVEEADSVTA